MRHPNKSRSISINGDVYHHWRRVAEKRGMTRRPKFGGPPTGNISGLVELALEKPFTEADVLRAWQARNAEDLL